MPGWTGVTHGLLNGNLGMGFRPNGQGSWMQVTPWLTGGTPQWTGFGLAPSDGLWAGRDGGSWAVSGLGTPDPSQGSWGRALVTAAEGMTAAPRPEPCRLPWFSCPKWSGSSSLSPSWWDAGGRELRSRARLSQHRLVVVIFSWG